MTSLPHPFFNRPVLRVARDLTGCHLVRQKDQKIERYMITETEAYDGHHDLASHASKGRTKRNEIMFGSSGYFYVYLVYGMYWMLNIVTGPKGYPAAVLIRGIEGYDGPGKLTRKLGIKGKLNGKKVEQKSGLWIEPREKDFKTKKITRATRIGIDYAGPIWSKKKYRFVFKE